MSMMWVTPASASYLKQSAVDSIARSYRIPITNPVDGVTVPSMLIVVSATLETTNPSNSQLHAPRGRIYLSLQMNLGSDTTTLWRSTLGRLLLWHDATASNGPSLRSSFGPQLFRDETATGNTWE